MQEKRKEITKPHSVITARMTLTAKEQDLLSLLIMKVKDSADSQKFKDGIFDPLSPENLESINTIFKFEVKELANILGTTVNTLKKQNRSSKTGALEPCALEKACQAIRNQDIRIRSEQGFVGRRLVSDAAFDFDTGILTLETTRTMAGIMLDYGLKNDNFGKTDMRLLFSLNGAFEKRILELISRFKNERDFKITLGEFCEILNVFPENYSSMANFRKNVIESPIARIVKHSNGMWITQPKHPKGFHLKRGAKMNDIITFKMKYVAPELPAKPRPKAVTDMESILISQPDSVFAAMLPGYLKLLEENGLEILDEIENRITS